MCLILEILMVLFGLYALIAGKVKLSAKLRVEGWRARVVGLFLIAPLPLAFLTGLLLGFILIGVGSTAEDISGIAAVVEALLVLGGLLGAVVFALIAKPKEEEEETTVIAEEPTPLA